jgi:hypothetical protein
MANDIGLRLTVDSSGAVQGFQDASRAAEDYYNRSVGNAALSDIQAQQQARNNEVRNQPGFNGSGSVQGGNPMVHGAAGANDYLRTQQDLSLRIQELTNQIIKSTAVQKEAVEKGDMKTAFQASSAVNQMEQEKARLEMQKKREDADEESGLLKALRNGKITDYVIKGAEFAGQYSKIGSQYRMAIANGDYVGAEIGKQESLSGMAKGLGGTAMGIGSMLMATGAGFVPGLALMGLGGLAEILGIWGEADAAKKRADDAEAGVYQGTLSYTNALNKRFRNGFGTAEQTDAIRRKGLSLSKDTGLTNEQFINAAVEMTRYGATSSQSAMRQARNAAVWANATGADLNSVMGFIGTSNRYGINADTGYLAGARNAMGLTKGQTQEFLSGLQSVIEDGISNGYIKSTEDVSKTMTMFYKLSGDNPLWTGEQGVARFRTINSTIANATAMNDTAQIMTVYAAKNTVDGMKDDDFKKLYKTDRSGTYIDYMLATEAGLTSDMFAGIGASINTYEGGNYAGRIERWRQMSGLNYSGAVALDEMYAEGRRTGKIDETGKITDKSWLDNQIKKINETYTSDETKTLNATEEIKNAVAEIGKSKFYENIKSIDINLKKYIEKAAGALKTEDTRESEFKAQSDKEKNRQIKSLAGGANALSGAEKAAWAREEAARKSTAALGTRNYEGAVDAWLQGTSFAFRDFSYEGSFYDMVSKGHDATKDSLFKEKLAKYAAHNDNAVSEDEVKGAFFKIERDRNIQNLYKSGSAGDFEAALERCFAKLFNKGIILQEQ